MLEFNLSKLCFGCEALGGTDWGDINVQDIEKAINFAVERGINFFDTADVYGLGLSEKRLSSILGDKRHDMFIATKGGVRWNVTKSKRAEIVFDSSPSYITKAVEQSLQRMKLETLPLYYIHWPDQHTFIKETLDCLNKLKGEGKIKYIGLSNIKDLELETALNYSKVDLKILYLHCLILLLFHLCHNFFLLFVSPIDQLSTFLVQYQYLTYCLHLKEQLYLLSLLYLQM